jgi:hypothetical protein
MSVWGLSTSLIPSYRTKFLRFTGEACIDGTRAWPPEDCRGPWTFIAILHAL